MKSNRRRVLASLMAAAVGSLLLAACSNLATAPPPLPIASETLSGRLSVRVAGDPQRAVSAVFELRGSAELGQLDLSTPLGSVMARARWSPEQAVLITPNSQKQYADLDSLSRDALGEAIPLVALFDWLHGRPWGGAPTTLASAAGFEQLGWQVDLKQFDQHTVAAERAATQSAPAASVRVRLDP